jgi:hypothetical protein
MSPPTTRTLPSGSSVDVGKAWGLIMVPVACHAPATGDWGAGVDAGVAVDVGDTEGEAGDTDGDGVAVIGAGLGTDPQPMTSSPTTIVVTTRDREERNRCPPDDV